MQYTHMFVYDWKLGGREKCLATAIYIFMYSVHRARSDEFVTYLQKLHKNASDTCVKGKVLYSPMKVKVEKLT